MWKNKLQVKFLLESFALQRQHLYSIDNHNMKQQEESFQNPQNLFHIHINKCDNLKYEMEKKLMLKKRVIRVTFKTGESNVFSNIY